MNFASEEDRLKNMGRPLEDGRILYSFRPNFNIVAKIDPPTYAIADFDAEIGVFSATPEFVRAHAGPLANRILDHVPEWYYDRAKDLGLYPNVDVRIHRLYPGDFPAYPGWHCDGEYRETYFSQPDLDKIPVSGHLICTLSSHADGVSNTRFLKDEFTCAIKPQKSEVTLWGQVDEALRMSGEHNYYDTKDGELLFFDSRSLHEATATKNRGWRLFFRMSMWHRPNLGDGGRISKQEHIYKLVQGSGW